MSLYRQVRTLYTLSTLIFTYIIWATASAVILDNTANYKVYIISLGSVFLMQYLREKEKKAILQLCIPFLLAIVVNVLVFNIYSAQYNSLYIFFTLLLFNKYENEEINYETYKHKIKKDIYILIVLGAVLSVANKEFAQNILRFYLIYLIFATILLRETRKLVNRNSSKKSLFVNLAIISSIILLSMDKIYTFLTMLLSYAWFGVNKIIIGVAYIIMYVVGMPIYFIIKLIFNILPKGKAVDKVVNELNRENVLKEVVKKIEQNDTSNVFVFMVILKIIIVIIIAYIIFKVFNKYVKKISTDEGEIQKEKIIREKKSKKKKESSLSKFMKIFKGEIDFKTQILNIYLKFERKMSDKEIYETHMTARQLSSAANALIDNDKHINSITSIYNEAKFSNHEISEENAKTAKLNYENIKKGL